MGLRNQLPNIGLVTLIAGLVWLYAEGQDVSDLTREVRLQLPDRVGESTVVDFAQPQRLRSVQVTMKGATAPLSQLTAQLGAGALQLPLTPTELPESGEYTIDLAEYLPRASLRTSDPASPTISDLGISVVSTDPAQVTLIVDQLVSRQVRVIFSPRGATVRPGWTAEPSRVEVTLLASQIEAMGGSTDALFVEAVPRVDLADLPAGEEHTLQMDLQLSEAFLSGDRAQRHVKLAQQTVDVTFTIARQQDRLKLNDPVPVWLTASPSELERYDVTLDETSRVLSDVEVEGPRDLIDRLRRTDNDLRVVARFELTNEELDRGVTGAPLSAIEIHEVGNGPKRIIAIVPVNPLALQPGVDPAPPTFLSNDIAITAETPTVEFTITRRDE